MAALRLKNGDDATLNPHHLLPGRFAKRPDTPWNSRPSTCQTGRISIVEAASSRFYVSW